jgi:pimeloyl-ACP methyl ester carboxylesterase
VTVSPGNFNYPLIENFASRTLGELSVIGKHATKEYFGVGPAFSYFTGCSGGGRQGLELAQTFPDAFDGILAGAPAVYYESILVAGYWPTLLMNQLGVFPPPCEIKAFTAAAVEQCDGLDGLQDGIISHPEDCKFAAQQMVGRNFTCDDGEQQSFTQAGARIVEAAWQGFNGSGISWPGVEVGADLSLAYVNTLCGDSPLCSASWANMLANFVAADPSFDPSTLSTEAFAGFLARSIKLWRSSLGAANPNLQLFQQAGGKLISWHGTADTTIPPKGSAQYYEQVLQHNSNVSEFFRHFEAPGVGHCAGGPGPMPNAALEQLVGWVENGTAPATLDASSAATGLERPLCPYPSRQVYLGGNANSSASFSCAAGA